ncbi:MAG: hypothetical protein ABW168_03340 [Sedimenticola sp.]
MQNTKTVEDKFESSSLGKVKMALYLILMCLVLMLAGGGYIFYSTIVMSSPRASHNIKKPTHLGVSDMQHTVQIETEAQIMPEMQVGKHIPELNRGVSVSKDKNKVNIVNRPITMESSTDGGDLVKMSSVEINDNHILSSEEQKKGTEVQLNNLMSEPNQTKNILLGPIYMQLMHEKMQPCVPRKTVEIIKTKLKSDSKKITSMSSGTKEMINRIAKIEKKNRELNKGIEWLKWGYRNNPLPGWRVAGIDKNYALIAKGEEVMRIEKGMSIGKITITKIIKSEQRVETNKGFIF